MNCVNNKKFIDAYMDGELEAGMMLEIENHLGQCTDCSGYLRVKRDLKSALHHFSQIQAPDHLRAQISTLGTRAGRVWWPKPVVVAPMAAAAALMLLFWSTDQPGIPDSSKQEVALVVQDVVDRHVRDLPMEINDSNQLRAASWFQGKIDFPVRPLGPGLKNTTFQGARVSNVRENQAAQMVYTVDGKKVTFMVFPAHRISVAGGNMLTVRGKEILTGRKNGYNVAMSKEGDMIYAVSSDLPVKRLVQLLIDRR
ncbi:MAG: zf-HC2 domain-containing protein [Deltaproteobacteria bacterium]|nr:zf-HC2 domain-containing protein [Deltaproteobacteria bacterium]